MTWTRVTRISIRRIHLPCLAREYVVTSGYRLSLCARTERRFESALFHAKRNYSSNWRRSLNTSRCAIVASIERVKIPLRSWIRAMVFAMVPSRLGPQSDFLKGWRAAGLGHCPGASISALCRPNAARADEKTARPTGFEPVTFGFVDDGWQQPWFQPAVRTEDEDVGSPNARRQLERGSAQFAFGRAGRRACPPRARRRRDPGGHQPHAAIVEGGARDDRNCSRACVARPSRSGASAGGPAKHGSAPWLAHAAGRRLGPARALAGDRHCGRLVVRGHRRR